jgi:hypothetical protein
MCEIIFTNIAHWIDAIRQIVSFVVLMAIDHKAHRRGMAFNKLGEHIRAL